MKAILILTPDEIRAALPKELQKLYDTLVKNIKDMGIEEFESKPVLAHYFLQYIKRKKKPHKSRGVTK